MKARKSTFLCLGGTACAILLGAWALTAGDEEKVSGDDVPAAIKEALKGVAVREIERETEDGEVVYEVELAIDGGEVDLRLNAEGKLLGVEAEGGDKETDGKKADDKKADRGEQERKVGKSDVPAAALKTLEHQAAGAEITEFAEEIEHGHTFYEGSWKSSSGSKIDVLVTEAGDLVEIEEAIAADKVPAAAAAAAQKEAGESAKLHFEKKTGVTYEVHFQKNGRGHELVLSPDGRRLEEEHGDGKEDGDDEKDEK